jgi:hypothetical protein
MHPPAKKSAFRNSCFRKAVWLFSIQFLQTGFHSLMFTL